MTYGEKAVGLTFNPSGDQLVTDLKVAAAAFIDLCNDARGRLIAPNIEITRMYSIAITEAQTAVMWGVKARTWTIDS